MEISGSGVDVQLTYDAGNASAKYTIAGSTTSNQTDRGFLVHDLSAPSLVAHKIRGLGVSAGSTYDGTSTFTIEDDSFFSVPFPNRVSGNYDAGFGVVSNDDDDYTGFTLNGLSGEGYTAGVGPSNNAFVVRSANAGNSIKFKYEVFVGTTHGTGNVNPQGLLFKVARFGSTADSTPNAFEADLRTFYYYTPAGSGFIEDMITIEAYDNMPSVDKRYILCVRGISDQPHSIIRATRTVETNVPANLVDGTITNG